MTPDSTRALLRDLFEVNTLWQFSTEEPTAVQKSADTWEVSLRVKARKIVYDSAGTETELPMDELIPVGVFARGDAGHDELTSPLYLEKRRITSGAQTITITVRGKPALAGIDPLHLLDWEEKEDDDNVEAVRLASSPPPKSDTSRPRVP